jgi:hypothetical protein
LPLIRKSTICWMLKNLPNCRLKLPAPFVFYEATEPVMDGDDLIEADTDSACDQTAVSKQDTATTVSASQSVEETPESVKNDDQVEE